MNIAVTHAYRLSAHAQERMAQRGICFDEVAAALHKRGRITADGIVEHHDPRTRITVKVEPEQRIIITIYRRRPWVREPARRSRWEQLSNARHD
jgi:hypothetical protein